MKLDSNSLIDRNMILDEDSFPTRAIHLDKSYFESWRKRIGFLAKWYSSVAAAKKELAKG